MLYLSYSLNEPSEFNDLVNNLKNELRKNNIDFIENSNNLENESVDKIIVFHSKQYLLDNTKQQEYKYIKENINNKTVIEVNLDDEVSELQNNGFEFLKFKNIHDTIIDITNVVLRDYWSNFIKQKITNNHKMSLTDDSFQKISFTYNMDINEPIIYLIFQGRLLKTPKIESLKVNEKPVVSYEQYFDSIDMEANRVKEGIKLYINQDVKKDQEVEILVNLNNEIIEGFYLWVEDQRKWISYKIDTSEFEKTYYNFQFNKILSM